MSGYQSINDNTNLTLRVNESTIEIGDNNQICAVQINTNAVTGTSYRLIDPDATSTESTSNIVVCTNTESDSAHSYSLRDFYEMLCLYKNIYPIDEENKTGPGMTFSEMFDIMGGNLSQLTSISSLYPVSDKGLTTGFFMWKTQPTDANAPTSTNFNNAVLMLICCSTNFYLDRVKSNTEGTIESERIACVKDSDVNSDVDTVIVATASQTFNVTTDKTVTLYEYDFEGDDLIKSILTYRSGYSGNYSTNYFDDIWYKSHNCPDLATVASMYGTGDNLESYYGTLYTIQTNASLKGLMLTPLNNSTYHSSCPWSINNNHTSGLVITPMDDFIGSPILDTLKTLTSMNYPSLDKDYESLGWQLINGDKDEMIAGNNQPLVLKDIDPTTVNYYKVSFSFTDPFHKKVNGNDITIEGNYYLRIPAQKEATTSTAKTTTSTVTSGAFPERVEQ